MDKLLFLVFPAISFAMIAAGVIIFESAKFLNSFL